MISILAIVILVIVCIFAIGILGFVIDALFAGSIIMTVLGNSLDIILGGLCIYAVIEIIKKCRKHK